MDRKDRMVLFSILLPWAVSVSAVLLYEIWGILLTEKTILIIFGVVAILIVIVWMREK